MFIYSIEYTSDEVLKLDCDKGSFYIKTVYLETIDGSEIQKGAEFSDEKEQEILNAGLAYSAEMKAVEYLARAEQCRFGLKQKLLKKDYDKNAVERALDYLEGKNWLNDERYASCWLNTRKISHAEGRTKLASELASRGIGKEASKAALDQFFEENDEMTLAVRCYEKCRRQGKDFEKTLSYMINHGFSYSLVKKISSGQIPEPENEI